MTRRSIFDIQSTARRKVKDPLVKLKLQKRELEIRYYAQLKDFVQDPQVEAWYLNQFSRIDEEIQRILAARREATQFGYRGDD